MSRVVAWGLVAVAVAAVLATAVIGVATGGSALESVSSIGLVFALCFPVLGALVVRRQGGHAVGWLMSGIGVSIALHGLADAWSSAALIERPGSLPAGAFFAWVTVWLWIPGWVLVTTLLPVLLPDGRPQGRRLLLARLDCGAIALMVTATAVISWPIRGAGLVSEDPARDADPALEPWFDALMWVYVPGVIVIAILSVASFASLVLRYRRADPDARRQIAWVVYGGAVAIVLALIGSNPNVGGYAQVLQAIAIVGSIAIAMFRFNLYDIGVVVNRTLVYGALTATLAGAYLASVLLLQFVLSPSSDLAIAGSTLAVAALFRPARARIQTVVDRRFYRSRYDARRTLEAFSARLRDEVALEALGAELRGVVSETFQPAHVSLWLRP